MFYKLELNISFFFISFILHLRVPLPEKIRLVMKFQNNITRFLQGEFDTGLVLVE